MNKECERIKDQIADCVSGILPDEESASLQRHLDDCSTCREYARALKDEDKLLTALFAEIDTNMTDRQERVLQVINRTGRSGQHKAVSPWINIMKNRMTKFAAAAAIIIALFLTFHFTGGPDIATVAWADVVEKFQSVQFFSAVFYEKENTLDEPEQIELWMGQGGNARMRFGPQVIFAEAGQVTQAFDIKNRQQVEPDPRAARMIKMLATTKGRFSLETVLKSISGSNLTNVTPLVNSEAIISEDLVVFDIQLNETQWMRIWALRESKLPVHIRVWHPTNGYCVDAFITYSKKQPDAFFDFNALDQLLSKQQNNRQTDIAYAFLKDPGGKEITPKDMSQKSYYHMPEIKRAGITKEGVFMVSAGKSRNQKPGVPAFYGFARIEDDLGRTYFKVKESHSPRDETSLDVFIPVDFPFDDRIPTKVILFCESLEGPPLFKSEFVGSVELNEWEQIELYPEFFTKDYLLRFKISLAEKLGAEEQADRFNRLLREIPDWSTQPRHKSLLSFWIKMADKEKNFEEAVKIGEVLTPLLLEDIRGVSRYNFMEYLVALAATDRLDEARALFKQVDAIDEIYPEKSDQRYYGTYLEMTIRPLVIDAELTVDQISKILGFNISQRKEYESVLERAKRSGANRKARQAAEKRPKEISDYYRTHPLPDRMELLERPNNEGIYLMGVSNTMPNHEDYKFLPINNRISALASILRYYGDIQPYELVPFRIEDAAAKQKLFADLIYKDGISPRDQAEFVLSLFGMELIIEDGESRKVLVAKYDGRPLKDYKDVKASFRYDAKKESKVGMMSSMTTGGFPITDLLHDLAMQQNSGIEDDGNKLIIFNETGITGPVSIERAFWLGDEGFELAKEWFKEQFGVTFTEETRQMKTYVIRKRE